MPADPLIANRGLGIRTALFEGALLRRFGANDKPKVFCIHAFADDGTAFTPLAASALADDFEVVACDLPGFGASPPSPGEATIDECAAFVVRLAGALSPDRPYFLIAHSVGSPIAVRAASAQPDRVRALVSIEGNLTVEDAYFSGRAASYDDPQTFKAAFEDVVWVMAQDDKGLLRYHRAVRSADARSMWQLGRDAVRAGSADGFGAAYRALADAGVRSLYLWGKHNTSSQTAAFVGRHALANSAFTASGHWKSVDAPHETGLIARDLFREAA